MIKKLNEFFEADFTAKEYACIILGAILVVAGLFLFMNII